MHELRQTYGDASRLAGGEALEITAADLDDEDPELFVAALRPYDRIEVRPGHGGLDERVSFIASGDLSASPV